jgi:hypothetical protein
MKLTRIALFFAALVLAMVIAFVSPTPHAAAVGYVLLFAVSAALAPRTTHAYATTLSVNELITDILDAFKVVVPMLSSFSRDFSTATARYGDTITAKISSIPVTSAYDANNGGFRAGAQNSKDLLTDVPVTLNQFRTVPIKIAYLDAISSKVDLYNKEIFNHAFALGKYVVDFSLSKVIAANFSQSKTEALANTTLDTLESIRTQANAQKMDPFQRNGLVSSTFAGALQADARVTSRDFYSQLNGDVGYRQFKNIAGFKNIWEYPDLPSTGSMSGFFFDPRAIVVCSRLPDIQNEAARLGIPTVVKVETVTDPETGLTLMGVASQDPGTLDVYVTVALLFGASAGKQGGAAGTITDYAGIICKTA